MNETLQKLIGTLEEKDRIIMQMRYLDGRTQNETAAAVDMTPAEVSRRERALLVRLRKQMPKEL
ncbi:MAG: hypothetical protein IKM31_06180 [Oscillospiraceae bacterium]|nr:hypothetical protein [Oscillospiraceae bacterium]